MRGWFITLWFACMAPAAAQATDLILTNGKIFTGDPARPLAEAIAIDRGRIQAVGSASEIAQLAKPGVRVVDVGGRLVTPGLVEAHGHVGVDPPGDEAQMPNLPWPGPTPEQALAAVRQRAQAGSGWIIGVIGPLVANDGRDWRAALDDVAPGRPVMLRPWWGHTTLVNTAALRALAIPDDVRDPLGGWYGRRANGQLDGRLRETAEWSALRRATAGLPLPSSAAVYKATAAQYASWGVTSYHHMANDQPLEAVLTALAEADVPVKWTVYAWALPKATPADAWREFRGATAGPNARIGGLKWVLDATPIERDAKMRAAYADRSGWSGRSNYSETQVREILRMGLSEPQQLALHVVGDGEMARLLTLMEGMAPAEVWRSRRVRIEHGDGLTPDLVGRAARLGVVVVQNPLHMDRMPDQAGVPMMTARLGPARTGEFQLMRSLLAGGVPFALGSDAGGPPANPFLNMMLAVANPHSPPESLSREQALTAYTYGGGYAEGRDGEKGRLTPGMAADLAVLSQDILTVPLQALPGTSSLLTLVDGKVVHAQGPFAVSAPAAAKVP